MRFLYIVVLALSRSRTAPDSSAQSSVVNVDFADNYGNQKSVEAVLTLPGKALPRSGPRS